MHEYQLMFDLSRADLDKSILGVGDGPASFNCEMNERGHRVISIDPVYAFSRADIQQRVEETYSTIISQVKLNPQHYKWHYFADADALGCARLAAMQQFIEDFEQGQSEGRYLPDALPTLRFSDNTFDLALCSHLLFLYSEQFSLGFHISAITELLRVSTEVRIFPLLGLDCRISPHLKPIREYFYRTSFTVDIVNVPYEFQVGGNQMLRLSHS